MEPEVTIAVMEIEIVSGEYKGKKFFSVKPTYTERVDDLQRQIDEAGIPLKLKRIDEQDEANNRGW